MLFANNAAFQHLKSCKNKINNLILNLEISQIGPDHDFQHTYEN